jgi:hypothetical protein
LKRAHRSPASTPSGPALFDLAVDVARDGDMGGAAIESLLLREHFDQEVGRVTVLLPREAPRSSAVKQAEGVRVDVGAGGVSRAIAAAVEARRHLLLVSAATMPNLDCVGRLLDALARDPMIGFAVPRFGTPDRAGVFPLTADLAGAPTYPRALLPFLPELYLCPEVVSGVVLMRREMLTGLRRFDDTLPSARAALLVALIQGRRLGYRTAIVNRAVTPAPSPEVAYPTVDPAALATISQQYRCHAVAQSWYAALSAHRREALLAAALAGHSGRRRRLLLDARGLAEGHNGTTVAILGMLDGLAVLDCDWNIEVLASSGAARWHDLSARYPRLQVLFDRPDGFYTVAVRLCQPWDLQTLVELHSHALKVAVTMLDTIMWDIIYPARHMGVTELTAVWEFAATHLDGLLFISEYSRRRFNFRFPPAPHVRQLVSGLSVAADGLAPSGGPRDGSSGDILIFGNDYDHKWLDGAVEWIADGFPFASVIAFGLSKSPRPNVRTIPSGQLTDEDLAHLYAAAKILCFPSFYEGFGLPIIEGLARGLDVVARRSELLEEIAAQYRGAGRILPFDDPLSLIECIGRSLAGAEVETLPLGTGIPVGRQPTSWKDVAGRIMGLVEEMAADLRPHVHDAREAALRILQARGREPA